MALLSMCLVSSSHSALSGKELRKSMHRYGRTAVRLNALNAEVSCAVNRDVAEAVGEVFQQVLVTH